MEKRLERSTQNQIFGGVCAGIAHYFKLDPTLVRIVFALAVLGLGTGGVVYLIAWLIMPASDSF